MASGNENTPDPMAAQLATLQERLQLLEEENLEMRNTNTALRRQLGQFASSSQQQNPSDLSNLQSNLLGAFNEAADPTSVERANSPSQRGQPSESQPNNPQERLHPIPVDNPAQQVIEGMREEMKEFRESILTSLPVVRLPVKKSRVGTISDTPFIESITSVELPRKFSPPDMRLYDGSTDPDDHVVHYKYKMLSMALAPHQWEAGMCRGFGETLAGPALTWFINLPYRTIGSYLDLADRFVGHFASSCRLEKTTDDLNSVQQRKGESLRSYVSRFNKERIAIPDLHQPTAVEALRNGLLAGSGLYKKLTKFKCYTMDQAMARAQIEIRWEEDKRNKKRDCSNIRLEERPQSTSKRQKDFFA